MPRNPANGEVEDTDVGFPGPTHAIAERALPMRVAMALLAVGAIGAGLVQIPKVDFVIDDFLRPSFASSHAVRTAHQRRAAVVRAGARHGARPRRYRDRLPHLGSPSGHLRGDPGALHGVYELFAHKWYFDELIDTLIVRPTAAAGRFARDTFERVFVDETLIGGTTGVVRAGSAAVRAAQSGFVRYYAALLVLGVTGVGFYFLLQS